MTDSELAALLQAPQWSWWFAWPLRTVKPVVAILTLFFRSRRSFSDLSFWLVIRMEPCIMPSFDHFGLWFRKDNFFKSEIVNPVRHSTAVLTESKHALTLRSTKIYWLLATFKVTNMAFQKYVIENDISRKISPFVVKGKWRRTLQPESKTLNLSNTRSGNGRWLI